MTLEPDSGWEVTRFIPIPTSISAKAQEFLGMGLALGDGEAMTEVSRTDVDGWREQIDAVNGLMVAMFDADPPNPPPTVETTTIADVPVFVVRPDGAPDDSDGPIYLDIHGGGLVFGAGDACRAMAVHSSAMTGMTMYSVDYRVPPDHPYPAALDDCLAVYRDLLERFAPERIVVGGGSAGGNLSAALLLRARDEGLPMPAALVLLTPEVDLTESGDSFATNLGVDVVLQSRLTESIALYAGDHDLTDPYLSPLFGDLSQFPPTFVQAGTRDLFLSNAVRMHRKLRSSGVDAQLHVFEGMPHGGFFGAPEDDDLAQELRRFLAAHV